MKLKKKSFFDEDDENLDPERRKMKEEQEAKENELFIQLFYPLSRKQKLEIWKIWENTINEDTFIRKKEIKDYCEENKCDFLTALCSILFKIHYLYRCTYILDDGTIVSKYLSLCYPEFENLKSFLEERYIKYLNNGNPITEEQREIYNLMIEYIKMERIKLEFDQSLELLRLVDPMRIFTFKYIHYEEIELKKMIEKLSKDRQNNPDEYINDKLKDSVKWKDAHFKISHQGHIKDMYYPVSKIETDIKDSKEEKTIKETREILKTKFSETELIRIFNELVKNKYISYDLELFLSCFGYRDEIEDKIIWKSTYVQFEIFISEIVQKEKNIVNHTLGLPRKKIDLWFIDKKSKKIEAVKDINCDEKSYPIYKIIYP